jgi:hypothetical protein
MESTPDLTIIARPVLAPNASDGKKDNDFFHENFIAPGAKVWVQGAYKYAGIGLFLYSFLLLVLGGISLLVTNHSYRLFCYSVLGSSLVIAVVLGLGSFKAKQWAIAGWIGLAAVFVVGLFSIPYGYELWQPALFSVCLAVAGFCYRKSFSKGGAVGVLFAVLVIISVFILVVAVSRPEWVGGPSSTDREASLTRFFTPESFIKTDKGKVAIMQLYGYSTAYIISGNISDDQILQKVNENPSIFNSFIYPITHSFGGYVDSIFFALVGGASV